MLVDIHMSHASLENLNLSGQNCELSQMLLPSQNPSDLQQSTHPTSTEIPVLLPTDMRHSPGSKFRRKTFRCHVCSVRYAVFYCSLCLETLCGSSKRSTKNSRQSVCFFSHIGQAHPEFEVVFRGLNSFNHVHPRLDHFQQDLSTRS